MTRFNIDFQDSDIDTLIDEAGSIQGAASKLIDKVSVSFFYIGGLVYRLHQTAAHLEAGYPPTPQGFVSYMTDEIGLSRRKTYALSRIYRVFRDAGLSADDLVGLGWRKCEIISRLPADKITTAVLERARNTYLSVLEKEIKSPPSQDPAMIKRRQRIKKKPRAKETLEDRYHNLNKEYGETCSRLEQAVNANNDLRQKLDDKEWENGAKSDPEVADLQKKIEDYESNQAALLAQYEKLQDENNVLKSQLPELLTCETPRHLILNFNSEQKKLFNETIRHAKTTHRLSDDIAGLWKILMLYEEYFMKIGGEKTYQNIAKKLYSLLMLKNKTPSGEKEEEIEKLQIEAVMFEDQNRGFAPGCGAAGEFYSRKTHDTL